MTRDREPHPMATPAGQAHAEQVESIPDTPAAKVLPPGAVPGFCPECRIRPATGKDDLCDEDRKLNAEHNAMRERMEADGDFGSKALSEWEKRMLREGKTFTKPTKKAGT